MYMAWIKTQATASVSSYISHAAIAGTVNYFITIGSINKKTNISLLVTFKAN